MNLHSINQDFPDITLHNLDNSLDYSMACLSIFILSAKWIPTNLPLETIFYSGTEFLATLRRKPLGVQGAQTSFFFTKESELDLRQKA